MRSVDTFQWLFKFSEGKFFLEISDSFTSIVFWICAAIICVSLKHGFADQIYYN